MKRILSGLALVAALSAGAKDAYDIRPDAAKATDAPTAVEWQNKHNEALKVVLGEEKIAGFVASDETAKALLAKVKGAYATDPLVATQIAAVSQWVMRDDPWYDLFWDGPHAAGRRIWVRALCATIRSAQDDYVKTFCLDQIRWCGYPCCATCLAKFAAGEKSKAVRDFAEWVIRELNRK